jgi:hypothetical protein
MKPCPKAKRWIIQKKYAEAALFSEAALFGGVSVGLGSVGVHAFLNSLPDVVAGFGGGLEQEAGLISDVLKIADEGGTVFAGLQVFDEIGIFRDAVAAGGEEVGELFLKVGT